mgnify:CR=1 FL=1
MPITYNKELDGWEAKDLTEDEKDALMAIACEFIAHQFGMDLANRLMAKYAPKQVDLEAVDVEEMGRA